MVARVKDFANTYNNHDGSAANTLGANMAHELGTSICDIACDKVGMLLIPVRSATQFCLCECMAVRQKSHTWHAERHCCSRRRCPGCSLRPVNANACVMWDHSVECTGPKHPATSNSEWLQAHKLARHSICPSKLCFMNTCRLCCHVIHAVFIIT